MGSEIDDFYTAGVNEVNARRGVSGFIFDLVPKPICKQLKFELDMLWVRTVGRSHAERYRGRTDLLINVGAGDAGKPGWINIDGYTAKGISFRCDARRSLPFPDKSARGIFTEHFFEHIDYRQEAPRFLAEARRVLRDDGVLRIIVPDAERYVRAYVEGGWQDLASIRPLDPQRKDFHFGFKYTTRMELINVVFRQEQEHKFAYDFETIEMLLKRNGFQKIVKQQYGQCLDPDVCIDLPERASESLYVDAVKVA
jgi:predicted SAM-dependent methyltransferase